MNLTLDTPEIEGIPTLIIAPQHATHAPVVFHVPGYTSTRESGIQIGYQIARAGMIFVTFDPVHHGARDDGALAAAADPEKVVYPIESGLDVGMLFFETIAHCLEDIRTLRAYLARDSRADVARCGVTGSSMGGYVSFLAFAREPSMLAAVPMIGVPCFGRRWRDVVDESAFSNEAWAAAIARVPERVAAHTSFVDSIDPVNELASAAPRALLVMNNDFDSDQPKLYALETVRSLRPVWAAAGASDALRLAIYPAGHTVTPEMERDAVAWFRRFLQP